jgi:hypothetical protein
MSPRASSYNWRIDPQFQIRKDHPRAFMRPQVQALLTKLRSMKTVQEPGAAEEIIYDLAWTQLYQKKQEVRLANIAGRLTLLWTSMRQNEDLFGPPEPQTIEQVKLLPESVDAPAVWVGNHGLAIGGNVGEPMPPINYVPLASAEPPSIDLDSKPLKLLTQNVIEDHYLDFPHGLCTCGRSYPTTAEWAAHVRLRIWRVLKNEFPPIGTEEK